MRDLDGPFGSMPIEVAVGDLVNVHGQKLQDL